MRSYVLFYLSFFSLSAGCALSSASQRASAGAFAQTEFVMRSVDDDAALELGDPLRLDALVEAVRERNPNLERARQAWRQALAQYSQATRFADTMLGVSLAPLSVVSDDVKVGFGAELSQPLPYPGKRRLRGEIAAAEAEAAHTDFEAVEQRLALMTANMYFDLFFLDRALEINAEHIVLLEEYGRTVDAHLQSGRAWQDDALKVDVDLTDLRQQRIALEADRRVVAAQLNALLHRESDAALPPPPSELPVPLVPGARLAALQASAIDTRPELTGIRHQQRGARAAVELAEREYYPDVAVMGSYNRMWPMLEHQIMVGLFVELPTQRAARRGAEDAARARVHRSLADYASSADEIRLQVATALERLREARDSWNLYAQSMLPAAENRVQAIRIGLDAGRTSFLEVIRAERELRAVRLRQAAALAAARRQRAQLDWAMGLTPGLDRDQGGAP